MKKLNLILEEFVSSPEQTEFSQDDNSYIDLNTDAIKASNDLNSIAEESIVVIYALETILNSIQNDANEISISEETINNVRIIENIYLSENNKGQLSTSLESYRNNNISLEGLTDNLKSMLKKVVDRLIRMLSYFTEIVQYQGSIFELQSNRISSLKQTINKNKTSKTIKVSESNYLTHGVNKHVGNFTDYLSNYKTTTDVLSKSINEIDKFQKGNFLNSFKALLSPLTGYEDFYAKNFTEGYEFVQSLIKVTNSKQTDKSSFYEVYESEYLLGMSKFTFVIPPSNKIDLTNVDSFKKFAMTIRGSLSRERKFEQTFNTSKYVFENVSSDEILKMLDFSNNLITSYKKMLSIRSKLSQLESRYTGFESIVGTTLTLLGVLRWFLLNYRSMLNTCIIMNNLVETSFSLSRGNVDKSISIAKAFIKA